MNLEEELARVKASLQEKEGNYLLLCNNYKKMKKESELKDKIIINQEKEIRELTQKVKMYEERLNLRIN